MSYPLNESATMLANRLKKNWQHIYKWAKKQNIYCFRIYDKDLPEYACAIDIYIISEVIWAHIQEYQAPKSISPEIASKRLAEIQQATTITLSIPLDNIITKTRQKQKGLQQYEKQASQQTFHITQEQDCYFYINLTDYLDTGLFLDHRITRSIIKELAQDKHFLNLFCYTASVSIYAALGGAKSTTNIDLSNTYLNWAQNNFKLNHIPMQTHQFIQADCLQWLEQCHHTYQLIFLDPPTFSNSKRMNQTLDIQKDYIFLIEQCMRLLDKNGVLIFSNNFKKFKLDTERLTHFHIEDISKQTIPKDFSKHPNIHHCWKIYHP